ncbi:chromate transporter [Peptoniphilus equinus]|uniref:Chromate transporter n=1 Tax=Peptoniphilus equinus TaxID=3016343 RepID=A0ABY7QTA4_9FIRM|nr:chromate transporter [Peptoniphilus equinus]WBW50004.1 chromate transporter [Peptoniphilus equinus]
MQHTVSLGKLFTIFFKINAVTFGGGYTIVPIVSDEFTRRQHLIDDDEMFDIVAMAQSGPGAMAISTSLLTGYKLRGIPGALTCLVASALPCLITLSIISHFYLEFQKNPFVRSVLNGISGVVCAVLLVTTYNMAKRALRHHKVFSAVMMGMVFILSFFLHVDTAYLILMSGMAAIVLFYFTDREARS